MQQFKFHFTSFTHSFIQSLYLRVHISELVLLARKFNIENASDRVLSSLSY